MESPFEQKLKKLEDRATRLEQEVDNEPDKDREMAKRQELSALRTQIAALENRITEQSRGNFLFLRVEFYFLLTFVYFMWPSIFINFLDL